MGSFGPPSNASRLGTRLSRQTKRNAPQPRALLALLDRPRLSLRHFSLCETSLVSGVGTNRFPKRTSSQGDEPPGSTKPVSSQPRAFLALRNRARLSRAQSPLCEKRLVSAPIVPPLCETGLVSASKAPRTETRPFSPSRIGSRLRRARSQKAIGASN